MEQLLYLPAAISNTLILYNGEEKRLVKVRLSRQTSNNRRHGSRQDQHSSALCQRGVQNGPCYYNRSRLQNKNH
jgi:hypothetical protein